jgi:hypothetical protein
MSFVELTLSLEWRPPRHNPLAATEKATGGAALSIPSFT